MTEGGGIDQQYETAYLDDLVASIKRFKFLADRPMVLFIVLRLALITASAVIPALAALQSSWLTWTAVLVTVLTGLDTNFRWGEEWRHFRKAQVSLQRLKNDYEYRKASLAGGIAVGTISTQAANFALLHADVENLRLAESDDFFKFRISEWKGADKPKGGVDAER